VSTLAARAAPGSASRGRERVTDQEREARILALTPLVRALARRYAGRGEPLEDLIQVGMVGLINAVDRFDCSRGTDLASFATPTILGEIRRHFRDRAWAMHVPRGLREAQVTVNRAVDDLGATLGRTPTVAEIADAVDMTQEEVLDAIAVRAAYRPVSLSAPARAGTEDEPLDVGEEETGYARAEGRVAMEEGLKRLPARERVILHLRFEEGLTQSQIGARLGLSQMHISRLIQRALERIRREADGSTGPTPARDG
jgi:RNA polymerase sigma-B factor